MKNLVKIGYLSSKNVLIVLTVLLFLIISIIFYNRVIFKKSPYGHKSDTDYKKSTDPYSEKSKTGGFLDSKIKPPAEYSAELPAPESFSYVSRKDPSGNPKNNEIWYVFRSNKKPEAAALEYKAELINKGFKIEEEMSLGGLVTYLFNKDQLHASLLAGKEDNGESAYIVISIKP